MNIEIRLQIRSFLNLFAFFVIASTVLADPRQVVLFKGMAEVIEIPWKQSLTFGEVRPFIPHPTTNIPDVIIVRNGKKVRQIRLREWNPENESFELLPGDEITFLVKVYTPATPGALRPAIHGRR